MVYPLNDAAASDPALVGVIAAEVARRAQSDAGLRGFVVTTEVYRTAPHGEITPDVEAAIAAAYHQLGEEAAVHISASPTHAGALHATFRNVVGLRSVLSRIEACWQAASSAEAIAFLKQQQLGPDALLIGVVVQAASPEA